MMELQEVEELFKNVNRGAIRAFLRNAAILKDPNATPEMKELAAQNVKAISETGSAAKLNTRKRQPKPAAAPEQAPQTPEQQAPQTPAAAAPPQAAPVEDNFHTEFSAHHGVDPVKFKEAWAAMSPEQQQMTRDWHASKVAPAPAVAAAPAAPAPVAADIKPPGAGSAVAPSASQPLKIAKSIDTLYDLFAALKKNL